MIAVAAVVATLAVVVLAALVLRVRANRARSGDHRPERARTRDLTWVATAPAEDPLIDMPTGPWPTYTTKDGA